MALRSPEAHPGASSLNGIALCAGVGGLELGLHIAEPRYRTVCYVERDSFAASALVARMADASLCKAPVWSDLATFDGRAWRGVVDLISAGYPCQPFSTAGRRKGEKDPRHLWPHVARIIRESEPRLVFLENVLGHIDLGFDVVVRELRGMGYGVEAGLFSAAETGASQWRVRLFALAYSDRDALGESRGDQDQPGRRVVRAGDRPDRAAARTVGGSAKLDDDVGADAGARGVAEQPGGEDVPLFPPGPFDLAAWEPILAREPALQPCIFRVADGLAHRMDRHHAAGNGVVPLEAAYAFRSLRAAAARNGG